MNNEPVVWKMDGKERIRVGVDTYSLGCADEPIRADLTDEEITEVFYQLDVGHSAIDFARAILRKAQEK